MFLGRGRYEVWERRSVARSPRIYGEERGPDQGPVRGHPPNTTENITFQQLSWQALAKGNSQKMRQ